MMFASPYYFIAMAVVLPPALAMLVRLERRRRSDLSALGDVRLFAPYSALPSAAQRAVSHVLVVSASALLLVALARPQFGTAPVSVAGSGRDILFVLDLSRSMNARDAAPSRMAAAKRAAGEIARALSNDRVGLVVFGGSAFLQLPATPDHSSLALYLDAASTEDIPDPGTNLGAGIAIAAAWIARSESPSDRVIVLLTDGEDRESNLTESAQLLRRNRLQVFVVGMGSLEGASIPERDSTGAEVEHRDWAGRVVTTRLEEARLRRLALETGGTYVRWDGDASVRPIVAAISQLQGGQVSSRTSKPGADRFQWPLGIAMIALLADTLMRAPNRP